MNKNIKYSQNFLTSEKVLNQIIKQLNLKETDTVYEIGTGKGVFVKRKCEQKGPKKVSTFSTRFHVVSNVFPKYQMLTF